MTESFKMCNIWKDELILKRNRAIERNCIQQTIHIWSVWFHKFWHIYVPVEASPQSDDEYFHHPGKLSQSPLQCLCLRLPFLLTQAITHLFLVMAHWLAFPNAVIESHNMYFFACFLSFSIIKIHSCCVN